MAFGDPIQTAADASGGSTTLTATFATADLTEGNIVLAAAASDDAATFSASPTGYDQLALISTSINTTGWYYKVVEAAESSVLTFSWSTPSNEKAMVAIEYEGPWEGQSSVAGQIATAHSSTNILTGDATPDIITVNSSVLLIAGFTLQDPNGNSALSAQFADSSAGNTYTVSAWNRSGTALGNALTAVAHRVVAATGTYNSSWDWAGDNSRVQNMMASFVKGGAAPPAAVRIRRNTMTMGVGR